ncbi:MAG TPA: hypothetical protein VES67_18685 [Vicinamibacterales bacterium]|nr:hypothetical protein [Vicinamibacterales bacterium]
MAVPSVYGRAAVIFFIVAAAAALSFRAVYEPDLWYHLAQGRENLDGRIVRKNTFSFTYPDYRQRYAPWLFDASMYSAWRFMGGTGVQALQALLLATTFAAVYRASRQSAPVVAAAAVLVAGVWVVEPRAIPRPHLASFAGLAICMLIIERVVSIRRVAPLWWAVPLVAIWSNFHVEVAFGVAAVAMFALAELVRPAELSRRDAWMALAIAVVCGVATLANPYGIGWWQYLVENRSVTGLLDIAELRPPYLGSYRAFFLYLVVAAAMLILPARGIRLWEIAFVTLAAAAGLRYLRFTPLIFIVTAPMVARRIGELMTRGLDGRAVVVTAVALAIAGARLPITSVSSIWRAGNAAIEPAAFFSPQAVAFARREGLHGPMFNSNNLGGYLAFGLYPDAQIFQDSRFQSYPPDHFRAILRAAESPPDWTALVAGVDWAMLSRARPDALSGIGRFPPAAWATVFRDDAVEIVVRRDGRFAAIAPK